MARQVKMNRPGEVGTFVPDLSQGGIQNDDSFYLTDDLGNILDGSTPFDSPVFGQRRGDINCDFFVDSSGRLVIIDETESIRQSIVRRLQTSQGEYRHNLNYGVPFLQRIAGKQSSLEIIRSIYQEVILETPGVSEVLALSVALKPGTDRILLLSARVRIENNTLITFSPVEIRIGGPA